jgi:hypothetical protein
VYYLETADSVAQPFLHGVNTPQYYSIRGSNMPAVRRTLSFNTLEYLEILKYQSFIKMFAKMLNRNKKKYGGES